MIDVKTGDISVETINFAVRSSLTPVYFNGSILTNIELYFDGNKFGTSWDNWSEEKELERKKFYETCLKNVLGNVPHKYN